jgi:hypothetical protein
MSKVLTQILPCGILPALSQHISRASELGIFENQYCLGCLPRDVLKRRFNSQDFQELSETLAMCMDQNFFQTLSTRMLESVLLGMARQLVAERYVCICI